MRVLLDTNILISFLRSKRPSRSAVGAFIRAAIDERCTLLFVDGVIDELIEKLRLRPDLAARISHRDAARLITFLRVHSTVVERVLPPFLEVGRDRKDDFLIAHGIAASADYLVTWDQDLLVLGRVGDLRMVTPAEMLAVLRNRDSS